MSSAEESGEEDYDYEQDYEDSYDYEMDAASSTPPLDHTIVGCQTDFTDRKNQLVTFNYSPQNLHTLIANQISRSAQNRTLWSEMTANLDNYKELFHLNNLRPHSLDYSSYTECSRQLNAASLAHISKPLCLFNTAALWSGLERGLALANEVFSVQTAIRSNGSLVYIASRCQNQQKHPTLNSFIKHSALSVEENARIIKNKSDSATIQPVLDAVNATGMATATAARTTTTIGNNRDGKALFSCDLISLV